MTPADAVLTDSLREAGYQHLTPWHLRCVEAYLAQLASERPHPFGRSRINDLHERHAAEVCDLRLSLPESATGASAPRPQGETL